MRHLSRTELVSEMQTRLTIRKIVPTGLHLQIVELIAEMIELAREPVPECYRQATAVGSVSWEAPTPPARWRCPCGARTETECVCS